MENFKKMQNADFLSRHFVSQNREHYERTCGKSKVAPNDKQTLKLLLRYGGNWGLGTYLNDLPFSVLSTK